MPRNDPEKAFEGTRSMIVGKLTLRWSHTDYTAAHQVGFDKTPRGIQVKQPPSSVSGMCVKRSAHSCSSIPYGWSQRVGGLQVVFVVMTIDMPVIVCSRTALSKYGLTGVVTSLFFLVLRLSNIMLTVPFPLKRKKNNTKEATRGCFVLLFKKNVYIYQKLKRRNKQTRLKIVIQHVVCECVQWQIINIRVYIIKRLKTRGPWQIGLSFRNKEEINRNLIYQSYGYRRKAISASDKSISKGENTLKLESYCEQIYIIKLDSQKDIHDCYNIYRTDCNKHDQKHLLDEMVKRKDLFS